MMLHKAEEFVRDWFIGSSKNFKWKFWSLYGHEYIIVTKKTDNSFVVDKDKSSMMLGPFNKEEFAKLLSTGVLEEIDQGYWNSNYRHKNSGDCDCGGWREKDAGHSYWCKTRR